VVLGLLAEGHSQAQGDDLLCLQSAECVDTWADLKKRKRAKAAASEQEVTENMVNGVDGIIGSSLGIGMDNVTNIHDNPMYDVPIVTAGPEVQACREL
jgi:hypothetical protein